MRLLNLSQYPDYQPDIEFKSPSTPRLFAFAGLLLAGVGLALAVHRPILGFRMPIWWFFPVAVIMLLLRFGTWSAWRKSLRPTNWLLRASGQRIWIKFRSFLNCHLPVDDEQMIELNRDEIAWVRQVRVKASYSVNSGEGPAVARRTTTYVDIGLNGVSTSQLQTQLAREENHPGASRFSFLKVKYPDSPVSIVQPGVIRVRWSDGDRSVRPRPEVAVEFFARFTRVLPMENLVVDYRPAALLKLPETEQNTHLLELKRIDSVAASFATRAVKKCSLKEAREFLGKVSNGSTSDLFVMPRQRV